MESSKEIDILTGLGLANVDIAAIRASTINHAVFSIDNDKDALLRVVTEFVRRFNHLMKKDCRIRKQIDPELYASIEKAGNDALIKCNEIKEKKQADELGIAGRDRAPRFGYKQIFGIFMPCIMDFLYRLHKELSYGLAEGTSLMIVLRALLDEAELNQDLPSLEELHSLYKMFDQAVVDSIGSPDFLILEDSKRVIILGESLLFICRLLDLIEQIFTGNKFKWCPLCFRRVCPGRQKYCSVHSPKSDDSAYRLSISKAKLFRRKVAELGQPYLDAVDAVFGTYKALDNLFNSGRVRVIRGSEDLQDHQDDGGWVILGVTSVVDLTRKISKVGWADIEDEWFCFVKNYFPRVYEQILSLQGELLSWESFLEAMRKRFQNEIECCSDPYWVYLEISFIENYLEYSELIYDKKKLMEDFIKRLFEEGKGPKEIMKITGVSKTYVYNVRSQLGHA